MQVGIQPAGFSGAMKKSIGIVMTEQDGMYELVQDGSVYYWLDDGRRFGGVFGSEAGAVQFMQRMLRKWGVPKWGAQWVKTGHEIK
jgi:hypothetical protein